MFHCKEGRAEWLIYRHTFAVDSKKHRAETTVICKIRPEVILNKKVRLSKFT